MAAYWVCQDPVNMQVHDVAGSEAGNPALSADADNQCALFYKKQASIIHDFEKQIQGEVQMKAIVLAAGSQRCRWTASR